jgi:PAS domain S-box-containing protein
MNDRIVGLLQLNSRRKGCFSLPVIEQLEGIAAHVGAALMRQQAEQALRESEAKFRELFDGAPVAYHELDMDGVVRRVNRAECALLGYQAEEMLGRPVWEFVAGVDREASREAIRRKLSAEQPLEPVQRRYARRDGGELWVEIHDILVRNAAAQTTGIRSALLDITERKRLAEDLERHVEKLARSNGDLERFAYVASHDLQEPLRMVASFTQLLAKRYSGRLDETADRYIYFAVDGARRMQQLIVDLLEYSRVNSKELDLRRTECEAVVQTALQNLSAAIDESGAVITRDPLPVLTADAAQLGQLFQNLIGNAIKFRGKAPLRIHIAATDNGPDWLFSVQDNGIGIDPRHSARIFQIFQRLHTREQYPGTGIGLAVCQKVVERHGGKIWVESEPGAGSTFRFTIPKSGKSE